MRSRSSSLDFPSYYLTACHFDVVVIHEMWKITPIAIVQAQYVCTNWWYGACSKFCVVHVLTAKRLDSMVVSKELTTNGRESRDAGIHKFSIAGFRKTISGPDRIVIKKVNVAPVLSASCLKDTNCGFCVFFPAWVGHPPRMDSLTLRHLVPCCSDTNKGHFGKVFVSGQYLQVFLRSG